MLEALVRLKVNTWRMDSGIVKHDLGWWVWGKCVGSDAPKSAMQRSNTLIMTNTISHRRSLP